MIFTKPHRTDQNITAVLQSKLKELEECAADSKNIEKRIKETQERLAWLEDIQSRTKAILDI